MRAVPNATDRLVLETASPWFRPFFLGGLGLLVLGAGLVIRGLFFVGQPDLSSSPGDDVPVAGLGLFLSTFGFVLTVIPLLGRMSYRTEIIIDRADGRLIQRDRTLLKRREKMYPLSEVSSADVEETRYVDGDLYFVLRLQLESGESVLLDSFNDRAAADRAVGLIRDRLSA